MKRLFAAAMAMPLICFSGISFMTLKRNIIIADNGETEYVIVRPENCSIQVSSAASKLAKAVKETTGAEIKIVTDKKRVYSYGIEKPHEILIGMTSREASAYAADNLLYRDFSVSTCDNYLVISAGSDETYSDAVEYIENNLISDGSFVVSNDFKYISRADYDLLSLELCGVGISDYIVTYNGEQSKELAESFCNEVLEKTGRVLECFPEKESENCRIIIGAEFPDEIGKYEYRIKNFDGSILISSPTSMGLSEAYNEFCRQLFEQEGIKNMKIDSFNYTGKLTAPDEYKEFITERDSLSNTLRKLTEDKKLNVAYFGGSVTVGYGASNPELYSWRALTTKWLRDNFPDAEITEINAAIGASGSHLGAFRTERDIISQKPDLLFVEFAVNDSYNGESEQSAAENYESIVRRVRKALPECDIVNIYITDSGKASAGGDYIQASAHDKVASAYGISSINVGKALNAKYSLKGSSSSNWSDFFTDSVHMTDKGYAEYAEVIAEFLSNELIFSRSASPADHILPLPLTSGADKELQFIPVDENMLGNCKGYTFSDGVFNNLPITPYKGYLMTSEKENSLEFTFTGTELSLFMSDFTSGIIRYTIDGKTGTVSRNSMNNPFPIVKSLEYGEHTIKIETVFGSSTVSKIGGFLIR